MHTHILESNGGSADSSHQLVLTVVSRVDSTYSWGGSKRFSGCQTTRNKYKVVQIILRYFREQTLGGDVYTATSWYRAHII